MSDVTWKDLVDTQILLSSIGLLEPLDERVGFDIAMYYSKWQLVGTDIIIVMKYSCKFAVYRKGGVTIGNSTGIKMPKFISLEEIISDENLDKKSRAKLAWLIGRVENYG